MKTRMAVAGLLLTGRACLLCILLLCRVNDIFSQDLTIRNPSFDTVITGKTTPVNWSVAFGTPDLQPGKYNVNLPAYDGDRCLGLHGGPGGLEGLSQKLDNPLQPGRRYSFSAMLAFTPLYGYAACYGNLVVYGGNTASDTAEVLYTTGNFTNEDWKRFEAVFTPKGTYTWLIFVTGNGAACTASNYGVAFVMDDLSPAVRELPQVTISAKNTCKDANTGVAVARVSNGMAPYTYLWMPGKLTGDTVRNLSAGRYRLTVTAANGVTTSDSVDINAVEIQADVTVSASPCYGYNSGSISVAVNGGTAPYTYALNGVYSGKSVFNNLKDRSYTVAVTDVNGCTVSLDNVSVASPAPLQTTLVTATPVSCTDTHDGKITLAVSGGTPPYAYSLIGSHTSQTDSIFTKLDAGRYYYEVSDGHDCMTTGSTEVTKEWRDCAVFVPSAFSPNGDGMNDVFRALVHDDVRDFRLSVYGRWGQLIFETRNPDIGWDGTVRGEKMPVGDYLWVLTYEDSRGQAMKNTGSLIMVR